ncbi:reverse transcriptase [Plakobranchus ocellatus]|uniref:Reverse transcriptase n=1 Tax=Plakobranchus ocellatus TaxID=259542 RepID=A0AAV4D2X1_9GAST|nr:reverse transcriptase [Plakobranchus ocellatus]
MSPLKAFMDDTTILCSKENETRRKLVRLDALLKGSRMGFKPKKSRSQSLSMWKSKLDEDIISLLRSNQSRYTKDQPRACQEPRNTPSAQGKHTTEHDLSSCKKAPSQSGYTWQHDRMLQELGTAKGLPAQLKAGALVLNTSEGGTKSLCGGAASLDTQRKSLLDSMTTGKFQPISPNGINILKSSKAQG